MVWSLGQQLTSLSIHPATLNDGTASLVEMLSDRTESNNKGTCHEIMEPPVQNSKETTNNLELRALSVLDPSKPHVFIKPLKRIHEGHDVPRFLISQAYSDIGRFIMQLNHAMCPRKLLGTNKVKTWPLDSPIDLTEPVRKLQALLESINSIIDEAPPDTGPRRFGNISFRKWSEILESRVKDLLEAHISEEVLEFARGSDHGTTPLDELTSYFLGGFGSSQRLDYGTGHELSFLAFLGCLWKLGAFTKEPSHDGDVERSIVLGVIEP